MSYVFPSVVLGFAHATVDTAGGYGTTRCGVVDSVALAQSGSEARVSVQLSGPVDTPTVKVTQRGRRVELVMRSRRAAGPLPDSVLFGAGFDDTIGVVVLDPGHGGKDPGAIGPTGVEEKTVTLKVGLALRDQLQKAGLTVYMTRDSDEFVGLRERTVFANKKNADLFISIHANAVSGNDARRKSVKGYKMYFLSQAKNEEDKLVAMLENAVVELEEKSADAGNLQNILTEMVNNEYLKESQDLSILLAETFAARLKKLPSLHTGVGQANFFVLNGAFMPAVLVETAFISHPDEEKLLATESFQKSVATAIFDAVTAFKRKYAGGM
jgi:N-acetylmuramoyl-L-alanine amidase